MDTMITDPRDFNFFLNSHGSIQGTSRPVRYYVLLDQNRMGADEIQHFAYWSALSCPALPSPGQSLLRAAATQLNAYSVCLPSIDESEAAHLWQLGQLPQGMALRLPHSELRCRSTYTFCRCTRAVSLPPPVYYAHLAAYRGRILVADIDSDAGDKTYPSCCSPC